METLKLNFFKPKEEAIFKRKEAEKEHYNQEFYIDDRKQD